MQDFVSMAGKELDEVPFRPARIMVGRPPPSDCLERSKSDNMI
jgi:hypothetical protein